MRFCAAKNLFLLAAIFLALSFGLSAQETSLGGGIEWNMNARENFAAGFTMLADYRLPLEDQQLTAGAVLVYSNNFSGFSVIEVGASIRWYFLGVGLTGFFAQAETGAFLISENNETIPMFMGGARAGFRFPMDKIYVEPFGRFGYPFAFGFGVIGGMTFSNSSSNSRDIGY